MPILLLQPSPPGGPGTDPLHVECEVTYPGPAPLFRVQVTVMTFAAPAPPPLVDWSHDFPAGNRPVRHAVIVPFPGTPAPGTQVGVLVDLFQVDPAVGLVWEDSVQTHVVFP